MRATTALLLVTWLVLGCGEQSTPPTEQPGRQPSGKADLPGSCQALDDQGQPAGDHCGGKSDKQCYCDEACSTFKDCCEDYKPICKFEPPSQRRTFAASLSFAQGVSKVPVAFFDADSTLRISKSGSKSPNGADDVMLLPGVASGLRDAAARGELVAIVSNQGGVAYGYLTLDDAEQALARTAELLAQHKARVQYFDFATTYGKDRKPQTGMAARLENELTDSFGVAIDWDKSYMVGDAGWKKNVDTEPDGSPGVDFSNSDRGFAENLSIPFHHPRDFFGWIDHGVKRFDDPQQVADFQQAHPDFGD